MENDDVLRDRAMADLAALQADRAALADRLRQPGWYDPALGVLVAGFFSTYSFAYPWVTVGALPVFGAGMALLVAGYRRHTGMWVNGYRGGPATKPVIRLWFATALVVLGAGLLAEKVLDIHYAMVVAGVLLGVVVGVLSRRWTTVYQRELREGR